MLFAPAGVGCLVNTVTLHPRVTSITKDFNGTGSLKTYVEESPGPNGLVQRLRDPCEAFRKAILDTKPIQQFSVGGDAPKHSPTLRSQSSRKGAPDPNSSSVINLGGVMKKIDEYVPALMRLGWTYLSTS